jgi:hypothetical protein
MWDAAMVNGMFIPPRLVMLTFCQYLIYVSHIIFFSCLRPEKYGIHLGGKNNLSNVFDDNDVCRPSGI